MNREINVLVTGAAGQIGYALLPRLGSGEAFGKDTRIHLRLVEVPAVMQRLKGTIMELQDCAFSNIASIKATSDMEEAAQEVDWALLVGSVPRGITINGKKIEERSDLLQINSGIFGQQGQAIGRFGRSDAKVLVVGNPANTNCYIGQQAAQAPGQTWMAMMALDAQRSRSMLALRTGCNVGQVRRLSVWGNHSPTMVPDVANAKITGTPVADLISDDDWLYGDFMQAVQQRGKAVIDARGASSAASAASAAIATVVSVENATDGDDCFAAAIASDGSYGVPKGLICGFPLRSDGAGHVTICSGYDLPQRLQTGLEASVRELQAEVLAVQDVIASNS